MFAALAAFVLKMLSGGMLKQVFTHLEHRADSQTERERISADIVQSQVAAEIERRNAQRDVLVQTSNHWLQWLFVVPLGVWFTAVILDSIFYFPFDIAALPHPLDDWAGWIISAIFLVDAAPRVVAQIRKPVK